jgi:hypothetical protein
MLLVEVWTVGKDVTSFSFLLNFLQLFSRVQNAARLLLLTGRKEEIGHFFGVSAEVKPTETKQPQSL